MDMQSQIEYNLNICNCNDKPTKKSSNGIQSGFTDAFRNDLIEKCNTMTSIPSYSITFQCHCVWKCLIFDKDIFN